MRARGRARLRVTALCLAAIAGFGAWSLLQGGGTNVVLPLSYASIIRTQARAKGLDPALIAAVIYAETGFQARTSSAGALGLMQILPATAEALAQRSGGLAFTIADLATPRVNIAYGSYYLRFLLDRYGGDEMLALAAYNAGEANVDAWRARDGGLHSIDAIPFPETRAYVSKVERVQGEYASEYASQLGG